MNLERALAVILAAAPNAVAVYVFGSAAREELRQESDVDLAVLARRPLDQIARWHLQEEIAAALGRDVDLVDLRAASTVMRVQVLRDGRLLYEAAPGERALFEATALASYARLQEERRGILDDVAARGSVHG
jgi:predicted nucleotidyltransferase